MKRRIHANSTDNVLFSDKYQLTEISMTIHAI